MINDIRFCDQCGSQIPRNTSLFCSDCGSELLRSNDPNPIQIEDKPPILPTLDPNNIDSVGSNDSGSDSIKTSKSNLFLKIIWVITSAIIPIIGAIVGIKYLFTKSRRRFGFLLLALGIINLVFWTAIIASDSEGLGDPVSSQDCESLKTDIIRLSEKQAHPFAPTILKIYDNEQETSRTTNGFICHGRAKINRGGGESVGITYEMKRDSEGDVFYGYELD